MLVFELDAVSDGPSARGGHASHLADRVVDDLLRLRAEDLQPGHVDVDVEALEAEAVARQTERQAQGLASRSGAGGGSIIIVLATDAPLLPHQCERLAQRASLGLARMGSTASHGSGDIFIAFSTANAGAVSERPLNEAKFVGNEPQFDDITMMVLKAQ